MGLIGVGDGRDPHPISIPAEAVVLTSLGQGQGQAFFFNHVYFIQNPTIAVKIKIPVYIIQLILV